MGGYTKARMDWYTLDGLDKMGNFVGVGGNKDP
jgi:hypothetical protein